MTFNKPQAPKQLKEIQNWFASIITRRIDEKQHINPLSPSNKPIEQEAKNYILPSSTLFAHERIELYNQQYWWRLLSVLQQNFPLTSKIDDLDFFNENIGYPYLEKYIPEHWSLNHLGDTLPKWMMEDYKGPNKPLLEETVQVDWAYVASFFSGNIKTLTENSKDWINSKLTLHPSVFLIPLKYNLLSLRDQTVEDQEAFFLKKRLKKPSNQDLFFVIYRNAMYNVTWEKISQNEYVFLSLFKNPISLEKACLWIEKQDAKTKKSITQNLETWFANWTQKQWLGVHAANKQTPSI